MFTMAHVLGLDDASGTWYLFWSGIGANIAMLGGAIAVVRKHNCHVRRCWRVGRLPLDGTPFVLCMKHHPESAPAADQFKGQ